MRVSGRTSIPTELVWGRIADPVAFGSWVAGTSEIVYVDPDWPQTGSRLWPRWGIRPLRILARTTVTYCRAPYELGLTARVHPIATVDIRIELSAASCAGTRVVLSEHVVGGLARGCPPLTFVVQRWRNGCSLRALIASAEAVADATIEDGRTA